MTQTIFNIIIKCINYFKKLFISTNYDRWHRQIWYIIYYIKIFLIENNVMILCKRKTNKNEPSCKLQNYFLKVLFLL